MAALGSTYSGQKRYAEAEALFTKVADRRMHVLGDDNPETLNALVWSGRTKLERQQYSEAEQVFRKALQVYEKAMPEEWDRFICQGLLGASLAGQRRFDEAEQLLSGAYEGMTQRLEAVAPSDRFELEEMKDRIIRMYENWGKSEKASEWKQ
jgi:tetratricopeptide (TPR) repeat protein